MEDPPFICNSTIDRHRDTYAYISPAKYAGSLKHKVVLITGAGRGIGRATAVAFAAAGASVACLSRTQSDLEDVVREIQSKGYPKAITIVGDITIPSLPVEAVHETEAQLGPIDILITNAGISRISSIEHDRDFSIPWKVIDANIKGSMAFIHAVTPSMIARKTGIIMTVVSVLTATNPEFFSAYSAAKAGMLRATHIIDRELRPHGILTYAVHPGMIADTTLGHNVLNLEAYEKLDSLKKFMDGFKTSMNDTLAMAADTFVALAAEPDARFMCGKYVDTTQDLGQVLAEAKKGPEGRIEKEGLYVLKVDTL
ncbi:MAG: hypothetical protein Q9167_001167 [Letrouitia subvulpina]